MSKFPSLVPALDQPAIEGDANLSAWLTDNLHGDMTGPFVQMPAETHTDSATGLGSADDLGLADVLVSGIASQGHGAASGAESGFDIALMSEEDSPSEPSAFASWTDHPAGLWGTPTLFSGVFSDSIWTDRAIGPSDAGASFSGGIAMGGQDDGFGSAGPIGGVADQWNSAADRSSDGDASSPSGDDLIFLDGDSFARGGKGGGGGGGGGSDPGVISTYTSGPAGGYNIEIDFKGTWTSDLQKAFVGAADRLSGIIVGDVPDVFFRGNIIDDIVISAELKSIDGVGGILGQSGPTAIRTSDYLPATASMQFDVADAGTYYGSGLWDAIVQHEMIHSVGFGTVWSYLGLVSGAGTANSIFTGADATLTYRAWQGQPDAAGVPLETGGGSGTADAHWSEQTFGNELMTGYINTGGNYLSDMTIASLEDLGYNTTWTPDQTFGQQLIA